MSESERAVTPAIDETDLAWAKRVLADNYSPKGCRLWWRSVNRNTGGVPAAQWRSEDPEHRQAVIRELQRLAAGGAW